MHAGDMEESQLVNFKPVSIKRRLHSIKESGVVLPKYPSAMRRRGSVTHICYTVHVLERIITV